MSTRRRRGRKRAPAPTSGASVLALPVAGIGLVLLFGVEWLVGNLFAAAIGDMNPGWLELAAIVPIMLVFAAAEIVLAVTAYRRGYGALWILFGLPAALALIAAVVWLAGGRAGSHGEPVWGLTAVFGGINLIILALAIRALRKAVRRQRRAAARSTRR